MDLRHYLFENRITIKDFAKQLEVSTVYLADIKNGKKRPNFKLAEKIIMLSKGYIEPKDLFPEIFEAYEKALIQRRMQI